VSTIALTCPSSFTSWLLAQCLLRRGHHVRLLGRSGQRLEQLIELGADVIDGSLLSPGKIHDLLEQVRVAYVVTPGCGSQGDRREVNIARVIAGAIESSDVEHLVYLSSLGADRPDEVEHLQIKAEVEQILLDTGRDVTILRPGVFMDNLWFARRALDRGVLALPMHPDCAFPVIAARDVALAALEFLTHEPAGCRSFDMPGHEPVTPNQITALLEKIWGRSITYYQYGTDEFRSHLTDLGMSPRRAELLTSILVDYDTYQIPSDPAQWSRVCEEMGLLGTSVESFAHRLTDPRAMPAPIRESIAQASGLAASAGAPGQPIPAQPTPAAYIPGEHAW